MTVSPMNMSEDLLSSGAEDSDIKLTPYQEKD